MVNCSEQLGKIFDWEMAAYIHEEVKKHDIDVLSNENTLAIGGEDTVKAIRSEKGTYKTDLVLVAAGIRSNTQFIQGTGIKMAKSDAIHINEYMETNVKDIYSAVDCTLQYHLVKGEDDYITLGMNANKQGRIAGMNMAGEIRVFKGIVGTPILRFIDLSLGRTGQSGRDAERLGLPFASVTVKGKHITTYYPGTKEIIVKLTYRPNNLLLLGGQVIGEERVDKRIDVLATA